MSKSPRRPLYHDYQPPELYRTGVALRRSFLTGPATDEEAELKSLLFARTDRPAEPS